MNRNRRPRIVRVPASWNDRQQSARRNREQSEGRSLLTATIAEQLVARQINSMPEPKDA